MTNKGFQKVLLITAPVSVELGAVRPNIGLGYLAQTLMDAHIAYDVLDMQLGYSIEDLKRKVDAFAPDLLGVNMFSNRYKTAFSVIESIKKHRPGMSVAVGGAHVSCTREAALRECPAIDFGVVYEGEQALLELCRGDEVGGIKGLLHREGGEIRFNGLRSFVDDLDTIPFPTYSQFEMDKYIDEKAVISSRGCPYGCIYCAVKAVMGRQVRIRSARNVVDEIQYWHERGCRQFSFQDDNFTVSRERVVQICDEIERRKFGDIFLRCAGARADQLDGRVLERMRQVGFKTIAIGVEAGNDRMLKILKKGERFEDIDNAVRLATGMGFDVYLNFLVGSPQETMADLQDTIAFAQRYPIFHADFSNIIPYPGTELYDWLLQKGYLRDKPESYLNSNSTYSTVPIFETPELPFAARVKVLNLFRKLRRKILRRAFVRKLKQIGVPFGVRHIVAYAASLDMVSKRLFQRNLRRIADRFRFRLYTKGARGEADRV